MNRMNAYLASRRDDSWQSHFSHLWIWLSAAVAALLLMWFVSVLNDITERGEQRRLQQRTSGMLLLPDEIRARGGSPAGAKVLSAQADRDMALR